MNYRMIAYTAFILVGFFTYLIFSNGSSTGSKVAAEALVFSDIEQHWGKARLFGQLKTE